jgi:hypothetical protein
LACRMEAQLWRNAALKAHHDLEPREVSYLSYPRGPCFRVRNGALIM